jgi:hypothetical protein
MAVLDFLLKCDLRPRKNTHCYGWLFVTVPPSLLALADEVIE